MKVKLFSIGNPRAKESKNQSILEDQLNRWLSENASLRIVHIKQSVAGGSWAYPTVFVSIWYEDSP